MPSWRAVGGRCRSAWQRPAAAAQRDPGDLTVIAVTKTHPATDIAHLLSLGVREIGENRAQELAAKLAELDGPDGLDAKALPAPHWHFIGQLQRNKAGLVARSCTALHTLDRADLLAPLGRAAATAGCQLEVFIQLSFDGDPRRGGVTAEAIEELADAVAGRPELRLAGLMGVPPLGAEPLAAFGLLRAASDRLQRSHPAASGISAGMSSDLEKAVMEGATHLRVGTALMGSRA